MLTESVLTLPVFSQQSVMLSIRNIIHDSKKLVLPEGFVYSVATVREEKDKNITANGYVA